MPGFRESVAAFAKLEKGRIDQQVRTLTLTLFTDIILQSPVGNEELWAVNRSARYYNDSVKDWNDALKENPDNVTKAGRLKPGRKLHDRMDITKPDGYVGGRFRGNWQTSIAAPATGTIDRVDPSGSSTISEVLRNMGGAGTVTFLVNNLPYSQVLEYESHSSQAPAGMVRISMARISSGLS
ncbi:hypothetical protein GCM10009552_15960 [Rothia nasimurium]|uniref:Uncharacterized protein n=1 Tax=Luteibacter anthropi TaxID=564369 RepID=A0A7X5UB78_9GAMM|nr:hypothetical protein [Luteibacter anthropi]NII07258.1 hypothetical protein [Luteibacter anthropi]